MTAATSTGLTAWAAKETSLLSVYAPLSWIAAGLCAFFLVGLVYLVFSIGRTMSIKARYNRDLYDKSGFVDPMATTFENKRIFLTEFCLPSDPHIAGKTFVNCEIIGPAVLYMWRGNQVFEHKLPTCDAVVIQTNRPVYNAVFLDNCTFRGCSFKRITIAVSIGQYESVKNLDWLNWFGIPVESPEIPGLEPTQAEQTSLPPQQGTATETQR